MRRAEDLLALRQVKPLGEFYKQAGGAQGRRGACKECFQAGERAAYARDAEVQAARRRQVEKWREGGLRL
jgi:hypothetical protein